MSPQSTEGIRSRCGAGPTPSALDSRSCRWGTATKGHVAGDVPVGRPGRDTRDGPERPVAPRRGRCDRALARVPSSPALVVLASCSQLGVSTKRADESEGSRSFEAPRLVWMELTRCHVDDLGQPGVPDLGQVDIAVVIDVVRAFTVAPWCLARGAERLLLAATPAAAVQARRDHFPDALLLKDGRLTPPFDLPNAPGLIARTDLSGRTIIQVTGNGTRGAHLVSAASMVLCASFATAAATARELAAGEGRALLVSTEGDEDDALADYLLALLRAPGSEVEPAPYLERVRRSAAGVECLQRGADTDYPGVDADDLARCLELDTCGHALQAVPDGELLDLRPLRPG